MATRNESSLPVLSHADGVATSTADILLLVGRIILAWVFLRSGYGKIFDIGAVAASYPPRGLREMQTATGNTGPSPDLHTGL